MSGGVSAATRCTTCESQTTSRGGVLNRSRAAASSLLLDDQGQRVVIEAGRAAWTCGRINGVPWVRQIDRHDEHDRVARRHEVADERRVDGARVRHLPEQAFP